MENKKAPATTDEWTDWRWQQRNACRDEQSLSSALGGLEETLIKAIRNNLSSRKVQITPYYISLMKKQKHIDWLDNPLFRQVVPFWEDEPAGGYDGSSENWELNHEMKTPICQHKYDNRVILRITNTCNSYCQFCFEALRTLQPTSNKENSKRSSFERSLDYIKATPSIDEVILSGGDPLMLTDKKLDQVLRALRDLRDDLLIRLHSRSLTFNPFRITDSLKNTFSESGLNSFGVHVCHPSELTDDFLHAVRRLQQSVPLIFCNTPLLKGVNDDPEVLRALFLKLYRIGVKPYYLYHFMPFSPGAGVYKNSISEAVEIMSQLKRRVSNIAIPEYVLPHAEGKFTVPLTGEDRQFPHYERRGDQLYYRFINWKGDVSEWLDN